MRLTPSWFRSSTDVHSEERSGDADPSSGVTIFYPPQTDHPEGEEAARPVEEFVPESDTVLLSTLDQINMPATVDEIADTLIEPRRPSIETWASVHQRLYEERLPALDESEAIEFDETQGIVERNSNYSNKKRLLFPAALVLLTISVLLAFVAVVSAHMLLAATITFVTTSFAVWFVPGLV